MDGNEGTPAPHRAEAGAANDEAEETARGDAPAAPSVGPAPDTPAAAPGGPATDSVADPDAGAGPAPSPDAAAPPPIFDLPDHRPADATGKADPTRAEATSNGGGASAGAAGRVDDDSTVGLTDDGSSAPRRGNGDRTLVLGGAAAAEGRTTGPTPRIGGPVPAEARPPAALHDGHEHEDDGSRGRHFRTSGGGAAGWAAPRWVVVAAAAPVFLLVLLLVAWAIDTAALSGQVQRNVEVAGRPVGGLGEESLPDVMASIADEVAARPVRVTSGEKTYETTAGEIGLTLDEQATSDAALDAGRRDALLTRPFAWLRSFFTPRDVDVRYTVSGPTATAKMAELQGAALTPPRDPTIHLTPQGWAAVPGMPGSGIDIATLIEELPSAAAESRTGAIEVEVGSAPVAPHLTDEQAQELADQANQMTANGLQLTAGDTTETVPPEQLRSWIAPTAEGGKFQLAINGDAVNRALPEVFADLAAEAKDARIVLGASGPRVIPSEEGVGCCGPDSAKRVWAALTKGQPEAQLDVTVTQPHLTTEAAQQLGVKQPVCGNNAWRNGEPTTAGPGFTTYYTPGEARVTNIHRIADIVDGTLVLPGETFSMNDRVGPRTLDKGFVVAGAIRDGEHVDEVGGGVSQFATTTFNAAYFCGLDITTYQAHSEYFARYPRGREATMGYPAPDLRFVNDTPYGVLIDTSYTDSSVTVTMWSTPYATGEQIGITESMSGNCEVVTTTRRITYPDKPAATDTFRATYRPGPGQPC